MARLTLKQIAEHLCTTPRTFVKYVKLKQIPHFLVGDVMEFDLAEVETFLRVPALPETTNKFSIDLRMGRPPAGLIRHLPAIPKPFVRKPQQYTYLIWAVRSTRYKIGIAFNPVKRLQALNTASPLDLKLLAAIPSKITPEEKLHYRFHNRRVKGEWFQFASPDDILPTFGKWTAEYYFEYLEGKVNG